jgi:hypothetical protein
VVLVLEGTLQECCSWLLVVIFSRDFCLAATIAACFLPSVVLLLSLHSNATGRWYLLCLIRDLAFIGLALLDVLQDLSWMCTTDAARGFRVCGPLALAVSLSNVWDPARLYDVPHGWRRATEADWRAHGEEAHAAAPGEVYFDRVGWRGCEWDGVERFAFVTGDPVRNWLSAESRWNYIGALTHVDVPVSTSATPTEIPFAGLVCVRTTEATTPIGSTID